MSYVIFVCHDWKCYGAVGNSTPCQKEAMHINIVTLEIPRKECYVSTLIESNMLTITPKPDLKYTLITERTREVGGFQRRLFFDTPGLPNTYQTTVTARAGEEACANANVHVTVSRVMCAVIPMHWICVIVTAVPWVCSVDFSERLGFKASTQVYTLESMASFIHPHTIYVTACTLSSSTSAECKQECDWVVHDHTAFKIILLLRISPAKWHTS